MGKGVQALVATATTFFCQARGGAGGPPDPLACSRRDAKTQGLVSDGCGPLSLAAGLNSVRLACTISVHSSGDARSLRASSGCPRFPICPEG